MLHQLVPLPRPPPAKTLLLSPFPVLVLPPPPPRPPPLRPPRLHICTCTSASATGENAAPASSCTTARERRLVKTREERRRREHDREHTYPGWAKVLENACRDDEELRTILGDSIGNPELMKQRIQERVRKKGRAQFNKSKTGSLVVFKVSFRDFNTLNSFIWLELYGEPTDRDVDLLGGVIQAWYVMGRLGAHNSSNLQLANSMLDYDPSYDSEEASSIIPSSFHDISDVEFQDNWARVWVDLGTSDYLALDVLLNCLTQLSSEHVGGYQTSGFWRQENGRLGRGHDELGLWIQAIQDMIVDMQWQCKADLESCLCRDVPFYVNNCHRYYNRTRDISELELAEKLKRTEIRMHLCLCMTIETCCVSKRRVRNHCLSIGGIELPVVHHCLAVDF